MPGVSRMVSSRSRLVGQLDLDVVDVGGGQLAEVDLQRAALPRPGPDDRRRPAAGGRRPAAVGPSAYQVTILVHSPGVGRRELLAEQRVEQGGLAGLDLAGDGQPQRPVQPVAGLGQRGCVPRSCAPHSPRHGSNSTVDQGSATCRSATWRPTSSRAAVRTSIQLSLLARPAHASARRWVSESRELARWAASSAS